MAFVDIGLVFSIIFTRNAHSRHETAHSRQKSDHRHPITDRSRQISAHSRHETAHRTSNPLTKAIHIKLDGF
jgi:hypothetical protein